MTTMAAYDGDLVRPLGFVTLYFAYAEGQLDEVFKVLVQVSGGTSESKIQSFGAKVGEAVRLVEKVGVSELPGLAAVLREVRPLVEARNELVHGQLSMVGALAGVSFQGQVLALSLLRKSKSSPKESCHGKSGSGVNTAVNWCQWSNKLVHARDAQRYVPNYPRPVPSDKFDAAPRRYV